MKTNKLLFGGIVLLAALSVPAQGTFRNLNFEAATIPATPVGGFTYPADPLLAFPGWTVGGSGTVVAYNTVSLGAPAVCLMGPNFPNSAGYTPLQGSYSVLLQYFGSAGGPPTLSQIGLVPFGVRSISFQVPSGQSTNYSTATEVSLNGVSIPLVPIADNRVAGDVSDFAGITAQLTFSTINAPDFLYFDDIQFSQSTIPEPSSLALLGVGGSCVLLHRRRSQSSSSWKSISPTPSQN